MDEVDQLTTIEAGHADLAEIGNAGQSELLSMEAEHCESHEMQDVTC